MTFLNIRLIDFIDIFLVAFLMFRIFKLIRGTVALNISVGLVVFVLFWLLIKAFNMELSASIMDNFVNVGVLALIVVFQQEIRRFLVHFGARYNLKSRFFFSRFFEEEPENTVNLYIKPLVRACESMMKSKTGSLIVITKNSELLEYVQTGEEIRGMVSSLLLESIFSKSSPLHDGAVIITGNKVIAAGCIMPVSQDMNMPQWAGLRHRAAMGITEATDAVAVVVSEETGGLSFFKKGRLETKLSAKELVTLLDEK